jgi:hypothetical protein
MFDISLPTANLLLGLSNLSLTVGAALVLIGTLGAVWSGGVRDRYADQRISENETKTATALADSARANAESEKFKESNTRLEVELEKERIERLRLEAKVQPRHLSGAQKSALTEKLKSSGWKNAEIIWHGTGEPEAYARDLASVFEQATIKTSLHTLGPFIPSAWGLMVIITENGDSSRLKAMLDEVGISAAPAETNDTIGKKDHPTLFVGSRED